MISLVLYLLQVILVLVASHLDETLEAQIWRLRGDLSPTERTHFRVLHHFVDATQAECVTAREKDVGLVAWRQEKFEAYGARVRHHLIIKTFFSVELASVEFFHRRR